MTGSTNWTRTSGKGTSFDPQNTIRIAFDWDDEEKRVVVGYIGRHQKNRRS